MLRFTENKRSLGELELNKPFFFDVGILNEGTEDVSISRLSTGCGSCTKAELTSMHVKPNRTEKLKITFTPNSTGYVEKTVTVKTKEQTMIFVFFANVK